MVRVVLLGRVAVVANGRHHEIRRAQTRGVFALLALNAGKHLSHDALAEALWAGAAPPSCRAQLHSAISVIRRLMADIGTPEKMRSDRYGYRLAMEAVDVDAGRFDGMLTQARKQLADGAVPAAVRQLECGLALWQGTPLVNASGAFVDAARSRLIDQQLCAWELLCDGRLALGRHDDVALELAPLVQAHPLREPLLMRFMTALALADRQVDALQAFRSYREQLRQQQGLDPGVEISRLEAAILRGECPAYATSVRAAHPPATMPPEIPTELPTVVDEVPAQLPGDISTFVGRVHQLQLIDEFTNGSGSRDGAPIVSIVGPAGIGKTALALRWAHAARDRYPDGQLYVDLRGFSPGAAAAPAQVLAGFVRALGGPGHTPSDTGEVAALYRTLLAGKKVLVLLDNAASAQQVRSLLPASPGSVVLVTSREALGGLVARNGAHRIGLSVFNVEESIELLVRMLGESLAQAGTERCAQLAELCGNLPLALRIAAAHLANQDDAAISRYLHRLQTNRLGALSVPGDEEAAVRSTFDWSYVSLPDPAKRVFRLVSLLPGSDLTAETCAHLAELPTESAEVLLERLAEAHLLERRAPGRYSCHDLLKDYAEQRANAEETLEDRCAAQERLMRWYVERTQQALQALAEGQEVQAHPWLESERRNLVAAVQWSQVNGSRELGRRLTESVTAYLAASRHLAEGRELGEAVLAGAAAADEPKGLATGRLSLAATAIFGGEYAKGIEHARSALAHSVRAGWVDGQIQALSAVAFACVDLGDMSQAAEHFHRIIALGRARGSRHKVRLALVGLASIYFYLGQPRRVREYVDRAQAQHRGAGDLVNLALMLDCLGGAHHQLGHLDEAIRHNSQALALAERLGRPGIHVGALAVMAEVTMDLGDPTRAAQIARQALNVASRTADQFSQACAHNTLGAALARQSKVQDAIDEYTTALATARQIGGAHPATTALVGRARAHAALGDVDAALIDAADGQRTARELGFVLLDGQALHALAIAHLRDDRPDLAAAPLQAAMRIHREHGHRLHLARTVRTARRIPALSLALSDIDSIRFWR